MTPPNPTPPPRLRAGVAKRDITIDSPNVHVHDPLYVKAIVLDDGGTRLAMVTMDVTSIGGRTISQEMLFDVADDFMPRLRRRVEDELDIPGGHVMVNASHTHPFHGRMLCDDQQQLERAFDAIREATDKLEPVTLGTGVAHEDRLTVNRTLRLKDGKHWCVRMGNPSPPDDEVADVGPIDPDIGLVRIDRADGRPLAVIYHFASHLLLGVRPPSDKTATADLPGFASKVIEDHLGHDAMAMFIQGTVGDVIEIRNKDFHRPKNAQDNGTLLGLTIVEAIKQIHPGDATLGVTSTTVEFTRRTDFQSAIDALLTEQDQLNASMVGASLNFKTFLPLYLQHLISPQYPAEDAHLYLQADKIGDDDLRSMDAENRKEIDRYLRNLRAMERITRIQNNLQTLRKHKMLSEKANQHAIPVEVQGLRLGDMVIVTSPAEVHVETGRRIKQASPFAKTFVASLTNGYLHYNPPADYFGKGGYEVTECVVTPQWERVFEDAAARVIGELGVQESE